MEKSWRKISGAGVLLIGMLGGCGETKELTLYLQDVKVRGPVTRLPVHITRDPEQGQITVTPNFWIASNQHSTGFLDGHSPVNGSGVFQADTIRRSDNGIYFRDPGNVNTRGFAGKNFSWVSPAGGAGVDVDLGLSRSWALSLGANYSSAAGKGLWGYRAGLGLRQHKGNVGLRLDVGWQWQSLAYESVTLASERTLSSSVATIAFYRDVGVSTTGNAYASLTVNGANPAWSVNPFFQLGISSQSLEGYQPTVQQFEPWILPPFFLIPGNQLFIVHDLRQEFKSTKIHATPGVYVQLDENLRLLAGAQLSFETVITDFSNPVLIIPFMQVEWTP